MRGLIAAAVMCAAGGVHGQAPAASVAEAMAGLAQRAAVVFVGGVEKIERRPGVVEVTFAVEQPMVGAAGGRYLLREWDGLWTGGQQPFHVGERVMVFLHGASQGGVATPVDGQAGVLPVRGAGAGLEVDVRRIAAHVLRPTGRAMPASGLMSGVQAGSIVAEARRVGPVVLTRPPIVRRPLMAAEDTQVQDHE